MNKDEIKSVMLRIDKGLHKQAVLQCVMNDIKFSQYVTELIKADLEKRKEKEE
ncbi:hypothetical protein [[Clostridium] innocuum]|jgi:predicted HicB family RNase H-like nuclease|uniref:hypothetical protein n=1 Tax=Clostridium innocuum TaxID=1522 RepID=UPI0015F44359|nr:hypothetical protein [[Clostridium] innocuum]